MNFPLPFICYYCMNVSHCTITSSLTSRHLIVLNFASYYDIPIGQLNQYDPDGRTPLSIAVKTGREDVVYSLLAAQASPDIPDEDTGRTPLFYAVSNKNRKVTTTDRADSSLQLLR